MAAQYVALQKNEKGQPRWVNRRGSVRYQCALATAGKVYPDHCEEFHRGWVMDLSRGGTGFLVGRCLPMGQEVILQISGPTLREKIEFPARVAHVTEKPGGEWLIGFEFLTPLTDDQMDVLL